MNHTVVGALGSRRRARVDERGRITLEGRGGAVGWWVGAEDRRHHPEHEAAVRQQRLGPGPVVETAMRVPSGDAVQRVYGVGGAGDVVVIEVENDSPVPFAIGFVVVPSRGRRRHPVFELPRAPLRRESDRRTDTLVYPVAHRTRLRVGLKLDPRSESVDLARLPDADDVARGWEAQLRRGMQVELPDEALQRAVDVARADVLLAERDVAALEDWGFDAEAATAWSALGFWTRRPARRRPDGGGTWAAAHAAAGRGGAGLLEAVRPLLVREVEGAITLLGELSPGWAGQALDVRDAPTRAAGRVSYAVRWHGDRPALLWECERPGIRLRAPGLDPHWSTLEPSGEALLAGSVDA